ncbi:MAG TPA: universal stress protein [Chitinophagaceae bacterium]|jgi:nucleotide-binding universal stress UspA family protein
MKTVIVPTDFSPTSRNAINYAVDLAKEKSANILLFHAYQIPVSMTDVPIALISVEDLQKNANNQIGELKKSLEQSTGGSIEINTEARLGSTVDELERLCERVKPFVVIMGTSGMTGIEGVLFGSTTLSVIKHLHHPVIVVPPGKKYTSIKKLGFATDLKEVVANTPAQFIKDFVKEFHADLYVLNVHEKNSATSAFPSEQSALLHTLLQELNPKYEFIEDENLEIGIERFAEANHLDLIIAIPKKHKLVERLFRKSHTKELVVHSHLPIMCVHA